MKSERNFKFYIGPKTVMKKRKKYKISKKKV